MAKTALITGISGQDGAYLAKFLLEKGYKLYGAVRRTSAANLHRLDEFKIKHRIHLIDFDLMEHGNIIEIIKSYQPSEIYNLAAQSFVSVSFKQPTYTGEVDGLAVTRMLEAVRMFSPESRFYQASTSEMYGKAQAVPQNEETAFYPRSPYGVAKLYAHWITKNYREAYGLFTASGILFNHESPLRGKEFVTRKITLGLANIRAGLQKSIELGNLQAKRDWGFAGDYIQGMWRMLQRSSGDDFVLATNKAFTVRQFVEQAGRSLDFDLEWTGEGLNEKAIDRRSGKTIVTLSADLLRLAETDLLIGDYTKAKTELGWEPKTNFSSLVSMMTAADYERVKSNRVLF
jgi:GDPmannose 4,6-dehydratase